jgi:hypothetical protein
MKNMPWRDFTALVASIGVVGLGLGATIPLTALTLDQRGIGSGIIGIITAISAFGILARRLSSRAGWPGTGRAAA